MAVPVERGKAGLQDGESRFGGWEGVLEGSQELPEVGQRLSTDSTGETERAMWASGKKIF